MQDLMKSDKAADLLADKLTARTPDQWAMWLRNNRNHAHRTTYRIPTEKVGREVFYQREELDKFIAFEASRTVGEFKLSGRAAEALHAMGIGKAGATSQGRRFEGGSATGAVAPDGTTFVQVALSSPLAVYRLTPQQAIELAKDLTDAAQHLLSLANDNRSPATYKVITADAGMTVTRKVEGQA
jgi:hypothetical protein